MKKKLFLLPLLLLLLALTGCSLSDDKKNFEYDEDVMAAETRQYILQLYDMNDTEYDYYINAGTDFEKSAAKGFRQADTTDHVGKFKSIKDLKADFKNGSEGQVVCSVVCEYEKRDVTVSIAYEQNYEFEMEYTRIYDSVYNEAISMNMSISEYMEAYNYYMQTSYSTTNFEQFVREMIVANGIYPYTPAECEVSANYSKSELLKSAGKNTAIGMITVFCVLIFISFIISLLKFVPKLFGQGEKKEKKDKQVRKKPEMVPVDDGPKSSEAAKPSAPPVFGGEVPAVSLDATIDGVPEEELIAVITAAIRAAEAEVSARRAPAYTASNDTLVVRSIRRVR